MKRIKLFFLLIFSATAIFFACNGSSGHSFKGTITNAANLQASLEQSHFDRSNVAIGKTTCDANGNFEISQEKPFEEGLYCLTIGVKRLYFIINGKEDAIAVTGELSTLDRMDVKITGSETFSCYAGIVQDLTKNPLKSPDEARAAVQRGCTPLMRAFLTTQLFGQQPAQFMDVFKAQNTALTASMPTSKYATDLAAIVSKLEKQIAAPPPTADGANTAGPIQVGMLAPDISLPGPDGKVHTLSGLRGKVVLLDFWASWCGPCRKANPHVVEMYKKYKSKGFEVFSVSLDRADAKDNWAAAIKQDGLIWANHVSDLKYWDCEPAGRYGVHSIPKTFLIGKDGKILALDPRTTLEQELMKVL